MNATKYKPSPAATKPAPRLVKTEEQTNADLDRWAAQVVKVLDERYQKPADDAPPVPDDKRPNVLIVSDRADVAVRLVNRVFGTDQRDWIDYGFALTGMGPTLGLSFDTVIYLPGWRPTLSENPTQADRDAVAAADLWRTRAVRMRFRTKGKGHEFYPG